MRIGKRIGNAVYAHKNYADSVIPKSVLKIAVDKLKEEYPHFIWDYIKFNKANGSITFSKVDDFDGKDEPEVIEQIKVTGDIVKKLPQHKNRFVIHGKHLMVDTDYKGFNYERLKKRFMSYQHLDKKRMGKINWWKENYLSDNQ